MKQLFYSAHFVQIIFIVFFLTPSLPLHWHVSKWVSEMQYENCGGTWKFDVEFIVRPFAKCESVNIPLADPLHQLWRWAAMEGSAVALPREKFHSKIEGNCKHFRAFGSFSVKLQWKTFWFCNKPRRFYDWGQGFFTVHHVCAELWSSRFVTVC